PAVGIDHDALLAVVHAKRESLARFVDTLETEEVLAVGGPVLQVLGADPDISQRLDGHGAPLAQPIARVPIERPDERGSADRLRLHLIPPRTNAGHTVVVAVHHLDRLAEALLGVGEAERASLVLVFLGQPGAIVPPHARTFLALVGLPVGNVDVAG